VHVLVTTLAVVLAARFERAEVIRVNQKLVMPAMLLMPPIPEPLSGGPVERSKHVSQPSEAAPAAVERPPAPAPVEEPASIEPEAGFEGSPDGIEGGVPGGVGDGPGGETASSGPGVGPSGPLRLGSTVIHSIPQLDHAALEAVRQWEYEPTRINGALVALIMTVVVNFAIQ
jgi:outer membrane biosynthesis protein TonB